MCIRDSPRNAAGGSLRQKDSNETKKIPLKFFAYGFGVINPMIYKTQSEFISKLKKWGFKTSKYNKVISSIDELINNHQVFEKKKFKDDQKLKIEWIYELSKSITITPSIYFKAGAIHGCVFCEKSKSKEDKENLVLHKGKETFILMNLYPYTNGH